MVRRFLPQLLLASLSGILYPLCFPSFDLGALTWFVLVPLHLAMGHAQPRRALAIGWVAGLIGSAGVMFWVITAMHTYGRVPLFISTLLMLLLAAYLALYWGLYAWGQAWLAQHRPSLILVGAPCLWVALEWLRTHLLSGLPWALLGYSQYRWLPIIQIADITGVYGVSFLIVLVNVMVTHVVQWLLQRGRSSDPLPCPWPALTTGLLIFGGALLYGLLRLGAFPPPSTGPNLNVGLVQANIDQAQKWDEAYRDETLNRYARLSRQAGRDVDVLIWPEAATPFLFEREPEYHRRITAIVEELQSPLLFGSPALRFEPNGTPYLLNSAYLLLPSGQIAGRYDKRHLVPFGEYIPLKSVLFFLEKLVVGIGDFKPGSGPRNLSLPARTDRPPIRFGVSICFEVIFPAEVRLMVKEGADVLVTITNDAWFGRSTAPYQHFGMVVFRAVENRIAFARAANTGISGFIAPDGRIVAATPIFTEQALQGRIPLRSMTTLYTKFGDVFAWGCVIMAAFVLVRARHHRQSLARARRVPLTPTRREE